MPDIDVADFAGAKVTVNVPAPGRAAMAASKPVVLSTEDLAAINAITAAITAVGGSTDGLETLISATNAALGILTGHVDGLEASATLLNGYTDGLETLIGSTNTVLGTLVGHVDGLEALIAATNAALALIGTRAYGAPATRLAYSGSSAQSAAIAATEVLLHNCGTGRCFVASATNPTATTDSIPLEPGEKFHLRITSGHKIAALQESTGGNLNIVPVA